MSSNLLLDSLPETLTVDGREYPIFSDFRTGIILEKILEEETDSRIIFGEIMSLFFAEEIPENHEEAISAVLNFYMCGEKPRKKRSSQKNGAPPKKKLYDFVYDSDYIYAAFMTQYHIDLNDIEYLHWWKFMAMFKGLESHNKIIEIIGYRQANLGEISNKKERARIANLQALYRLPNEETVEDKIARTGAMFGGMR